MSNFTPEDERPTFQHNQKIEPGMLVDRFELERFLGNGGMGEVWLAVDPNRRDDRRQGHVVLKFLRQDIRLCAQAVRDFQTVYRRVQDLIHTNICPLLDLGNDVNLGTFQVMHFVSGKPLDEIVYQRRESGEETFSVEEVIDILSPVADALDFAHEEGIIHRDIKPGNIMLDDQRNRVRVVDFGLAAEVRTSMSLHSQTNFTISGTEAYMSPEQWRGQELESRSDQYSLGVVAWELLTGKLPFVGSGMQLGFAVTNEPLPELPIPIRPLQKVFEMALSKKPEDRFSSCKELISALKNSEPEKKSVNSPVQPAKPPSISQPSVAVSRQTGSVVTNSIGMEFKALPAGTFTMGEGKQVCQVTLTKPFEMGVHAVTQAQYEQVMGTNPSHFKGTNKPVEEVSWDDAVEFCRMLSELPTEKAAGHVYRLPTEAEWEYSCRAGSTTKYCFGDDESRLGEYAWYKDNSRLETHPVGEKKPNAWGLYDMHGNAWEWCHDYWSELASGSETDPVGPVWGFVPGFVRVFRGGSWSDTAGYCLSSYRYFLDPSSRGINLGFRVARGPLSQASE